MISGELINALAIATRCFSPPDNSEGKCSFLFDNSSFFIKLLASSIALVLLLSKASLARYTFSRALKSDNKFLS